MSGISPRTAELALLALRKVLELAEPRRNGTPVPADILQAFHELGSVDGTKLDAPARRVRPFEQVDVATAAVRLGITPRAVRKRCAAGTVTATRVGRCWLIELEKECL